MTSTQLDVAYYYPDPFWREPGWIKNLLLFFDGVAVLVPAYMRDRLERVGGATAAALRDAGLLHVLEPDTVIGREATQELAAALVDLLASGVLDDLGRTPTRFAELSRSRFGFYGDPALAEIVYKELEERGLARPSEDGVSIPMHPTVRLLILVLLAQIVRPAGERMGLALSPTTDRPRFQEALKEVLGLPSAPSAGRVLSSDLAAVGINVADVPLDQVLRFRADNGAAFRQYARDLRRFIAEIGDLHAEQQDQALADRQAEIAKTAAALRKAGRAAWKKRGSVALGIAGAVWRAAHGDPWGAMLSLGGTALSASGGSSANAGAYSYLFAARDDLSTDW